MRLAPLYKLVVVSMLLLPGCMIGYLAKYSFRVEAERLGPFLDTGEAKAVVKYPESTTMALDNEHATIEWTTLNDYGLNVRVTNKTERPLTLRFDEATITDNLNNEMRFSPFGHIPKPLIVPPRRTRKGTYFFTGQGLFYPPGGRVGNTPEEIVSLSKQSIGGTVHLVLPVEALEGRYEYRVSFTMIDVASRSYWDIF